MKPFLKWAGNKYRLIRQIRELLPSGHRLVEPFAGSAAVFLNTTYPLNLVNDQNADLVELYLFLQQEGPMFIAKCRELFIAENNTPEAYYRFRREFNETVNSRRKAALFVYLNRHGYNGLCRYNRNGAFNVPFGQYKKPYFPQEEMMEFHQKSRNAEFQCQHFAQVMEQAQAGDVIYCDPPYAPLSETANFTSYNSKEFTAADHLELARLARKVSKQGIPVLISNHRNDFTLKAYAGADITSLDVQRFISCDGKNRNKAAELLALFR